MSKYTTEVRYICEFYAGLDESKDYDDVDGIISNSMGKIFDFDFPIFDEAYRGVLERKILKHYYTREIGFETVGLWKLKLNTRMNEIMPYYNKLYNSELINFNPLYDVDITTDHQKVNTDKTTGENSSSGEWSDSREGSEERDTTGWNLFQDTPQNGLTDVSNMNYLSNATKVTNDDDVSTSDSGSGSNESSGEFENNFKGIEDYLQHVSGSTGGASYSRKLKEYRETFLNIDVKVINELKDLFIYLW